MRWFTSVSVGVSATAASLFWAPMAYACPLCFASSGPGVLRAYLVSAFFMIGLAWAVIGGYGYTPPACTQKPPSQEMQPCALKLLRFRMPLSVNCETEQLKPGVTRRRCTI